MSAATVHSRLRRHRRAVLLALAVLAVATAALTVHATVMSGGMDDHVMGDAAALCLSVGGALIAVGAVGLAARRLLQRPLWRI